MDEVKPFDREELEALKKGMMNDAAISETQNQVLQALDMIPPEKRFFKGMAKMGLAALIEQAKDSQRFMATIEIWISTLGVPATWKDSPPIEL